MPKSGKKWNLKEQKTPLDIKAEHKSHAQLKSTTLPLSPSLSLSYSILSISPCVLLFICHSVRLSIVFLFTFYTSLSVSTYTYLQILFRFFPQNFSLTYTHCSHFCCWLGHRKMSFIPWIEQGGILLYDLCDGLTIFYMEIFPLLSSSNFSSHPGFKRRTLRLTLGNVSELIRISKLAKWKYLTLKSSSIQQADQTLTNKHSYNYNVCPNRCACCVRISYACLYLQTLIITGSVTRFCQIMLLF